MKYRKTDIKYVVKGTVLALGLQSRNWLKFSLFRKQILLFSFEPKTELNYFLISALASTNGWNHKNEGTLLHYLGDFNLIDTFISFYLTYLRCVGQISKKTHSFLASNANKKICFQNQLTFRWIKIECFFANPVASN